MTQTNAIAHDIARDVLSVIEQSDRHVEILAVVEFSRTPKRQHYTSDKLGQIFTLCVGNLPKTRQIFRLTSRYTQAGDERTWELRHS